MYLIVPLTIYILERLVRLVLPHVRNTQLVDVKLMGGNEKVCLPARVHSSRLCAAKNSKQPNYLARVGMQGPPVLV